MKPIQLRQRGRQWEIWLDVDEAVRRVRSKKTADRLVETYGASALVPVSKKPDGKLALTSGGKPARFTKDDALGFAHQLGRYALDLGDFVYTYVDEQREAREARDKTTRHPDRRR